MIDDFFQTVKMIADVAEKTPVAIRATRIFLEHVTKGESIKESLLKTSQILAAEALI
jgi:hypothetical protein